MRITLEIYRVFCFLVGEQIIFFPTDVWTILTTTVYTYMKVSFNSIVQCIESQIKRIIDERGIKTFGREEEDFRILLCIILCT